MSHEYTTFKWIIAQIDQGCPSLDGYENYLPRTAAADYCNHFASEEQFMERAMTCLDDLTKVEFTAEMIAGGDTKAAIDVKRLADQSKAANRGDIIALLKEDWQARYVSCAA